MAKREMKTRNVEETKVEQSTPIEKKEPAKESSVLKGIVVGCNKLNVRKAPKKDSDIVSVIDAGSKLTIDPDKSTGDWYRVRTDKNLWGFCMRKYVEVK